jgi:hypothetical protein
LSLDYLEVKEKGKIIVDNKVIMKVCLGLILLLVFLLLAIISKSQDEEVWYPEIITVDGKQYVPKEDFDYVYQIVQEVEQADLQVVEFPSIEITTTDQGQIFARFVPDKNTLRVKIGYIDKSIPIPASWLNGNVIFGTDWNQNNDDTCPDNSELYKDYWSFILGGSFNTSYIKGLTFGASLNASIYTPYLSFFRGFATVEYDYGYELNSNFNYHMPAIKLGIMFYYDIE